ncbi:unnamed protein product [Prunus armeniaca]
MIIQDELPFSHVEGIGFCEFLKDAQPRFDLSSSTTIARDEYQEEKAKIKNVLTLNEQRVSLTTNTWTSIQIINYMVLTAHFIDDDWARGDMFEWMGDREVFTISVMDVLAT